MSFVKEIWVFRFLYILFYLCCGIRVIAALSEELQDRDIFSDLEMSTQNNTSTHSDVLYDGYDSTKHTGLQNFSSSILSEDDSTSTNDAKPTHTLPIVMMSKTTKASESIQSTTPIDTLNPSNTTQPSRTSMSTELLNTSIPANTPKISKTPTKPPEAFEDTRPFLPSTIEPPSPPETRNPSESTWPIETPTVTEAAKPVEILKPTESLRPTETPKTLNTTKPIETPERALTSPPTEIPKPVEALKPTERPLPTETPKAVDNPKPVGPPVTIVVPSAARPSTSQKPIESPVTTISTVTPKTDEPATVDPYSIWRPVVVTDNLKMIDMSVPESAYTVSIQPDLGL
jgi:hypothetical protein